MEIKPTPEHENKPKHVAQLMQQLLIWQAGLHQYDGHVVLQERASGPSHCGRAVNQSGGGAFREHRVEGERERECACWVHAIMKWFDPSRLWGVVKARRLGSSSRTVFLKTRERGMLLEFFAFTRLALSRVFKCCWSKSTHCHEVCILVCDICESTLCDAFKSQLPSLFFYLFAFLLLLFSWPPLLTAVRCRDMGTVWREEQLSNV